MWELKTESLKTEEHRMSVFCPEVIIRWNILIGRGAPFLTVSGHKGRRIIRISSLCPTIQTTNEDLDK